MLLCGCGEQQSVRTYEITTHNCEGLGATTRSAAHPPPVLFSFVPKPDWLVLHITNTCCLL